MGAMSAYAISYLTEGIVGPALFSLGWVCSWRGYRAWCWGSIHGWLSQQPRVNDVAVGIAMIIFGGGLANFLGKPFIQPQAPQLQTINIGGWSSLPQVQSALQISPLFILGYCRSAAHELVFLSPPAGGCMCGPWGDSPESAQRRWEFRYLNVRMASIVTGSFLAGIGGACLSLYYPGVWTERISSGQGLMAVALVTLCSLAALANVCGHPCCSAVRGPWDRRFNR